MAKIVTLQILVDSDDESEISDGLNDMLRTAAVPVDPKDADDRSWIIDWQIAWGSGVNRQLVLQDLPDAIEDAICNNTYSEGDAFPSQSVPLLPDFEYSLIPRSALATDKLWITVPSLRAEGEGGDLSVSLKRTDEGVILDVWPANSEEGDCLASAGALFSDSLVVSEG